MVVPSPAARCNGYCREESKYQTGNFLIEKQGILLIRPQQIPP